MLIGTKFTGDNANHLFSQAYTKVISILSTWGKHQYTRIDRVLAKANTQL